MDNKTITTLQESHQALKGLLKDINATGGLTTDENQNSVPVADPDWIDLGITAEKAEAACKKIEETLAGLGAPVEEKAPKLERKTQ